MISDAMKRNIPSVRASTRELWFATGGPWCVARRARHQTAAASRSRRRARPAGRSRLRRRSTRSRRSQPERSRREGRDDDLVDPLVLDGLSGGRERIRVRDLAVRVDALAAQDRQRAAQAALGLGMSRATVALRRDDQELAGPFAARSRICSSSGSPTTVSFATTRTFASPPSSCSRSTTTCSTGKPPAALDPFDDVLPQPAGALLRMRRDDDLVGRRSIVAIASRARQPGRSRRRGRRGDPGGAWALERALEPAARRGAARVLVDDVDPRAAG